MNGPTPEVRDLARRLVFAFEPRPGVSAADLAAATAAAFEVLCSQLDRLIGADGVHALLQRALHLSRGEFAWLEMVRVEPPPGCALTGLQEAVDGRGTGDAGEAFVAVMSNVLWLLVTFIGDDLTLRLVWRGWPELRDEGSSPPEDDPNE